MEETVRKLDSLATLNVLGAIFTFTGAFGFGILFSNLYQRMLVAPSTDEDHLVFLTLVLVAVAALLFFIHSVLMIWVARLIRRRERFGTVFVVMAINAIIFPFGTLLFAFGVTVLSKPAMKSIFNLQPPTQPS